MTRAIVAAAVHWPSYRVGSVAAEGPDEDAFTLGVAAVERLDDRPSARRDPIDSIHLVGEFPSESDAGFPEALGTPQLAIHRHREGLAGLGAALREAARIEGPGRSLVVVADLARDAANADSPAGAGAVAFELQEAAGLLPIGHGGRRHPAHRAPDANAWVEDAVRYTGLPPSGAKGTVYFVSKQPPPVLLAFWRKAHPGMTVVPGEAAPAGIGGSVSLAAALWTLDLATRPEAGEFRTVARVTPDDTWFAGFRSTGGVEVHGSLTPGPADPSLGPRPRPVAAGSLGAVSEGAYVARARYLENLPSRWRLAGERCGHCRSLTFPARARCRECGASDQLTSEALPRTGVVLASTVVAPGAHPTEFDPLVAVAGSYGVVLAELAPKVRATFQVADRSDRPIPIGAAVTTVLRRLYPMEGEWRYGRKALAVGPG